MKGLQSKCPPLSCKCFCKIKKDMWLVITLDVIKCCSDCFQPEFTAMREQYMRKGEGFIICYSITDRRSFDEVIAYKNLINRVRCRDNIPIVIAANKCDLEDKRKVSQCVCNTGVLSSIVRMTYLKTSMTQKRPQSVVLLSLWFCLYTWLHKKKVKLQKCSVI